MHEICIEQHELHAGDELVLQGWETWEAAVFCAAVSAGKVEGAQACQELEYIPDSNVYFAPQWQGPGHLLGGISSLRW